MNPTTYCSICLGVISISFGQSLYLPHYTLSSSEAKEDIFQRYIWFAIMSTVENTKYMEHKFKVIAKISHRNFPKAYLEETMKISLVACILLWSQIRMEILFMLLGIRVTQGMS